MLLTSAVLDEHYQDNEYPVEYDIVIQRNKDDVLQSAIPIRGVEPFTRAVGDDDDWGLYSVPE